MAADYTVERAADKVKTAKFHIKAKEEKMDIFRDNGSLAGMNLANEMKSLVIRGVEYDPPLFCAPMAAITGSAFRRLLADFGGYGALFTEMLSARMILNEDPMVSPWLKRRPQERKVIYQLMVLDTERLDEIIGRLAPLQPDGLDLNVACAAYTVRRQGGGADLFGDLPRLGAVLRVMRKHFQGPLTVKIRLGERDEAGWREKLREHFRLYEGEGVDGVTVHPRFHSEKFKRSARHALYPEIAAWTSLPIIANGDITGPDYCRARASFFAPAAGIMIGRLAAACPWIFAKWHEPALAVDHAAVWNRLCDYTIEDFNAVQALVRLKILAPYFARNFTFGHEFFKAVQSASDFQVARERSCRFLAESPGLAGEVAVSGI